MSWEELRADLSCVEAGVGELELAFPLQQRKKLPAMRQVHYLGRPPSVIGPIWEVGERKD